MKGFGPKIRKVMRFCFKCRVTPIYNSDTLLDTTIGGERNSIVTKAPMKRILYSESRSTLQG